MRTGRLLRLAAAPLTLVMASSLLASTATATEAGKDASAAAIGGPAFTTGLQTRLTGANEVDGSGTPNQGDPDGVGLASVVVEQSNGAAGHPATGVDVCVRIIVTGVDTPVMAHIHKAAAGVNGAVVIPLPTPVNGTSTGCVASTDAVLSDLVANPAGYYVNVHTTAYPNGALRGQLAAGPSPMTASMSGANEVNASGVGFQGDPDGVGQSSVLVDPAGLVCAALSVANVDAVAAGHIHSAAFGTNGPIVVPFTNIPTTGSSTTCESVTPTLAASIVANPAGFYTNVHSAAYPSGAVRGQLGYGITSQHAFGSNGAVYQFGDAGTIGSTSELLSVANAVTPSGAGQLIVTASGALAAFGDATLYGSALGLPLVRPIVGITLTPTGKGYWEVASDGGIFAYGDAGFYGSTGSIVLNKPIVAMASTPTGRGYWMVASDGGVFAFGDAGFYGSTGSITLVSPVVAIAPTPSGHGYWLAAADGGVFSFGDAGFSGSAAGTTTSADPYIAISALPVGSGYRLLTSTGIEHAFGDAPALGSVARASLPLPGPIVSYTR